MTCAGRENRTLVLRLEGGRSTTKLYPQNCNYDNRYRDLVHVLYRIQVIRKTDAKYKN